MRHSAATRLRLAAHGIDHGHQFDVREAGQLLGVEAAQAAGSDDGDAEFAHGLFAGRKQRDLGQS